MASRIPNGDVMPASRSRGFTYIGLMILLAIMALVAAAGLKMGSVLQRAAAEEELLEIGAQFSEALRSYAAATPPGKPTQPPSLKELLKDPRYPNVRRHLRKIFVDPMTGKAEWGIVYLGDKVGVLGVYSLSTAKPLKVANFDVRFVNLENRDKISDWKFLGPGGDGGLGTAVVIPPNSMTGAPPPSLFPAALPGDSGGKSGAAPGAGGGKGSESATGAATGTAGATPSQQRSKADAPAPEVSAPVEPPPEEEKPEDGEPKQGDGEEGDKKVEQSQIIIAPPVPSAQRH